MSHADLDLQHFLLHHVPHEVMHWDGKLGRTLRDLVLAPGKVAAEYVRGCRRPYLNPLRLYLVAFVGQAFLSSLGVPVLTLAERVRRFDTTGLVTRLMGERVPSGSPDPTPASHAESLSHWLSEAGTLLIVFIVALALMGVMWKYRRRYLEHLTLALNVVTFTMLVVMLGDVVTLIAGRGTVSELADAYRINTAACVLPFYWMFAIRRFYAASWGGAVLYALTITIATLAIAQVINIVVLMAMVAAA